MTNKNDQCQINFSRHYRLELPRETIAYICLCAIAVSYYELIRLGMNGQRLYSLVTRILPDVIMSFVLLQATY